MKPALVANEYRQVLSWGRLPSGRQHLTPMVAMPFQAGRLPNLPGLACGMRRSYGDVCLNPGGELWDGTTLDHFIAFDSNTGHLVCEAGVTLRDIQRLFLPLGWLLPVTPGTQMVTVGGAIANDVHGKNHHARGTFGHHVVRISLARTDGSIIECGPGNNAEWFAATVGGLGLTGIITQAEIKLRKVAGPWLDTETISYSSLDEFFELAGASETGWEHTVSWVDCISGSAGRGLFMRGNSSDIAGRPTPVERQKKMPFNPPISLVNGVSLRAFNFAYYHGKRYAGKKIMHHETFSYPLDNIHGWNRMYGPRGFYQYQCVVPHPARSAISSLLGEVAKAHEGSFLAVLKTFGEMPSIGLLSFPQAGATLALDFPNRGEKTVRLFDRLDAVVSEAGGRIYPAKDARMPRALFESGYPHLRDFLQFRDPGISSGMSRRLMGS